MEVKAKAKYIHISPRKTRLVADILRGLTVEKALDQLTFINKGAVRPFSKLLNSAIANAENNFELTKSNLYIKEIKVDEGPTLKRWMPRARGRATPIRKRTSHIDLTLSELVESGKTKAKKVKLEAPVKLTGKPKEDEGVTVNKKDKKEPTVAKADRKKTKETKEIVDPRMEGKGKRAMIEGQSKQGFVGKIFRRKSG